MGKARSVFPAGRRTGYAPLPTNVPAHNAQGRAASGGHGSRPLLGQGTGGSQGLKFRSVIRKLDAVLDAVSNAASAAPPVPGNPDRGNDQAWAGQ